MLRLFALSVISLYLFSSNPCLGEEAAHDHSHDHDTHHAHDDMKAGEEAAHDHSHDHDTHHAHDHMKAADHEEHNHDKEPSQEHVHQDNSQTSEAPPPGVGVEEKLGKTIPLGLKFHEEHGKEVALGDLIDKPTLLLFVFYYCPVVCPMMMANLAHSLNKVSLKPGKDYRVISLSFDHEDTPGIALNKKENYVKILGDDFPPNAWKFLTGTAESIQTVTSETGFQFLIQGSRNFVHPNVLIVLGEDGKIIRYLYGSSFLPFDITMALTEAEKGTPGVSIRKILTFCFNYDAKNKKYVFKTMRIFGGAMILFLVLFFVLFLRKGKRKTP